MLKIYNFSKYSLPKGFVTELKNLDKSRKLNKKVSHNKIIFGCKRMVSNVNKLKHIT